LKKKDLGRYTLTELGPGIDSIIAMTCIADPDFDNTEELIKGIIEKTQEFITDMVGLVR
jgi:hypothetical protein